MKNEKVPVVFATDHNFIMPTSVAIQSMLECSTDCSIDIFILHDKSLSEEDMMKMRSVTANFDATINFINMNEYFINGHYTHQITVTAYYRLMIPWVVSQYDKVIYCDGDIIFKESISKLYEVEIENHLIGAVHKANYSLKEYKDHSISIGVNPDNYINSEVLLINCSKFRLLNKKDELLNLACNKYRFMDQDIINISCKDDILFLPERFNATPYKDRKSVV